MIANCLVPTKFLMIFELGIIERHATNESFIG
jgi:hypothetical protein